MFFVLSKILSFLTATTTWICVLFISHFIVKDKRWKKILLITGTASLLFFTNPFISNSTLKAWEVEPIPIEKLENHDIALVFSGMTMPARDLKDRIFFNKAADRIMMAVHLYKVGKVKKIMISGGQGTIDGSGDVEAETLKEFLLMLEIPEDDIICEPNAQNTHQNAVYSKELIDTQYPNAKVLLITSAFHMRRSYACTQKAALACTPFPVDYHTFEKIDTPSAIIVPQAYAIYNWDILIHELVGYMAYWATGKI